MADRNAKHADERERLARAGWTVLRRNGYANAGITEILAEAELGTRAFYRHFSSKDELLIAMFRDNASVTAQRLTERVEAAGSPTGRLIAWIDEILSLAEDDHHREIALMFASPSVRSVFEDAGDEVIAQLRTPLLTALADGVAAGEFADCDPDADAKTIHAIVWQLFTDRIHDRSPLDPAAARAQVERFTLDAIGWSGART